MGQNSFIYWQLEQTVLPILGEKRTIRGGPHEGHGVGARLKLFRYRFRPKLDLFREANERTQKKRSGGGPNVGRGERTGGRQKSSNPLENIQTVLVAGGVIPRAPSDIPKRKKVVETRNLRITAIA